jgi:hypothetical protein
MKYQTHDELLVSVLIFLLANIFFLVQIKDILNFLNFRKWSKFVFV